MTETNPRTHKVGPGFFGETIEHVRKHHAVMDRRSRKVCRDLLLHVLKVHEDTMAGIGHPPSREFFSAEFADDLAAVRDAITLIPDEAPRGR